VLVVVVPSCAGEEAEAALHLPSHLQVALGAVPCAELELQEAVDLAAAREAVLAAAVVPVVVAEEVLAAALVVASELVRVVVTAVSWIQRSRPRRLLIHP